MSTLLIHHPVFAEHLVPFGHPERPERIQAVEEALAGDRFSSLVREEARMADVEMILLCHPQSHLDAMRHDSPSESMIRIDAETTMSPKTLEAAL
ncbi:MAG: histone deacetylase family protein, partial [Rhizobiales bacterium]|nr:histone deacetylase family protein [Hyphomicrobiales bacterium]